MALREFRAGVRTRRVSSSTHRRIDPPRTPGTPSADPASEAASEPASSKPSLSTPVNLDPLGIEAEPQGPEPQYLRNRRLGLAVERGRVASHCLIIVALLDLCGCRQKKYPTLVKAVMDAVAPRRKMLIENQPIPKFWVSGYRRHEQHYDDLVGVAQLALIKAIDSFRPTESKSFSSYAAFVIRDALRTDWSRIACRGIQVGKERLRRLVVKHHDAEALAAKAGITIEHASDLTRAAGTPVYLDAPLKAADDSDSRYLQVASSETTIEQTIIAVEDQDETRKRIRCALETLSHLHRIVVAARIMADEPESHMALSRRLGIRLSEVKQIESAAITLLREKL